MLHGVSDKASPGRGQKGCTSPGWQVSRQVSKGWRGEVREGTAGSQGLLMVTEGGCSSLVVSPLNAQTDVHADHSMFQFSPSNAIQTELSALYRIDKTAPSWSYMELEGPHSHGRRQLCNLSPRVAEGWSQYEILSPVLVTEWPHHSGQSPGGGPCHSGFGGRGCVLGDMALQPWHESGRTQSTEARVVCGGCSGSDSPW